MPNEELTYLVIIYFYFSLKNKLWSNTKSSSIDNFNVHLHRTCVIEGNVGNHSPINNPNREEITPLLALLSRSKGLPD